MANHDINVSHFTTVGQREYQEDVGIFFRRGPIHTLLICDGHGGDKCSKFISNSIAHQIKGNGPTKMSAAQLKTMVKNIIIKWDQQCFHELKIQQMPTTEQERQEIFKNERKTNNYIQKGLSSGTTLELAHLDVEQGVGTVIHIGDSRAVWKAEEDKRVRFTTDQKPDVRNAAPIPYSVTQATDDDVARMNGVLAMGRAIGDNGPMLLGSVPRKLLTREIKWDTNKPFKMVLASDGVWDVITNTQAIQFSHAKEVVQKALEKGTTDNTTCILLSITPKPKSKPKPKPKSKPTSKPKSKSKPKPKPKPKPKSKPTKSKKKKPSPPSNPKPLKPTRNTKR
jgi:serine/threonine protein phosphatase PrpC